MPKIKIFWDVALCVHIQPLAVQVHYCSSLTSCPVMIHTHLRLNAVLARGRKWEYFFRYWGNWTESIFVFLLVIKSQSSARHPAAHFRAPAIRCGICVRQTGTGTDFAPSTSGLRYQCHSTSAP